MPDWSKARAKLEAYLARLHHMTNRELRQSHAFGKQQQQNFYKRYWQLATNACDANLEDLGYGFTRISRGDSWTIVNNAGVMLDNHLQLKLLGNKPLTYKLLEENRVKVPAYIVIKQNQFDKASAFLNNLNGPIVVKPAMNTGAGRGITTGVRDEKQLRLAINRAAVYTPTLLLEEQLELENFRLLYLNGQRLHAVHRTRPSVTGDGKKTIEQLVDQENQKRQQSENFRGLSLITKDIEFRNFLKKQGYTPESKLEAGKKIAVKNVINQHNRYENHPISEVHPQIDEICSNLCNKWDLKLAGVDIMANNLSDSPELDFYINEVNTTPGLHHHALVSSDDAETTISGKILEHLLSIH